MYITYDGETVHGDGKVCSFLPTVAEDDRLQLRPDPVDMERQGVRYPLHGLWSQLETEIVDLKRETNIYKCKRIRIRILVSGIRN